MARLASRLKLGFYPLVYSESERIRRFLRFPAACAALDPCAGKGRALQLIAGATGVRLYGIELDSLRAEEAAAVLDEVIQGSVFDTHCPVESCSLLYLNPPYDDEVAEDRSRRTEGVFLEHCFRWLQPRGVLILVIPAQRLSACSIILAAHFRDLAVYRLAEPEAACYRQAVLFGMRRTRHERERFDDRDFRAARTYLLETASRYAAIAPLPDIPDRVYAIPAGTPTLRLHYRGLPLDAIEDLLATSRAYGQAARAVFAPSLRVTGRPLTPLHEGHAGIVSCAGLLNGVFGSGDLRHVACWQTDKTVDRFEETDENEVTTIRERERFTQSLTLVYADGRTAELSEGNDAQCAPADGPS
ncbi:MAG: DUF6094 domain-containing protein [Candidatus Acidiferrales bacterium]